MSMSRWTFAALAYLFAGLALVGVFVPGLPTTPFVLLAAWAASRGSRRLHDWLSDHPRLGPPLRDWRDQRAIAPRARLLALGFLALSWALMYLRGAPTVVLALAGSLFVVVGAFVATRPRPGGTHTPRDPTPDPTPRRPRRGG